MPLNATSDCCELTVLYSELQREEFKLFLCAVRRTSGSGLQSTIHKKCHKFFTCIDALPPYPTANDRVSEREKTRPNALNGIITYYIVVGLVCVVVCDGRTKAEDDE